jgi:HEPN domain-containing protein
MKSPSHRGGIGKPQLARAHLDRARHAVDEGESVQAIVWSALCAEVAVDAIAASSGIDTRKDHFRRASISARLHEQGLLESDLRSLLIRLNDERKRAVYGGATPDLRGRSWSDVLSRLEDLVEVAEERGGESA